MAMVLNQINQGKMNGEHAAEMLGWSARHVRYHDTTSGWLADIAAASLPFLYCGK